VEKLELKDMTPEKKEEVVAVALLVLFILIALVFFAVIKMPRGI